MLDTVLPFPFTLWQPKLIATDGNCEFYLKLAHSPEAQNSRTVRSISNVMECYSRMQHEMQPLLH